MIRKAQVVLWLAAVVVGTLAASSAGQGPPGGAPPGLDKAIAAMEKHADKWLDKPNVVGVGIGENKAGKAVIHVYRLKDDDEGIPSEVDGVAVEQVRSGRFDPRALPTDRWPRPVPIGVSSGLADFATGTLGARVTNGTNVYALSNNHVFAGVNTASIGDAITQPGVEDGGSDPADRIATLADYQAIDFNGGNNIMDAAIAVTSAGNVATATPPDGYGTPSTTPTTAAIGMGVQKYGRTTGFQLGAVQDVNFSVDVCYFALGEFCFPGYEARFVNQISVSNPSFSAPGDSGSLIVTQGGNQPVALLFAGDGQLTIGNPIIPVLQRFGVTIDGAPPGDGPPGASTALTARAGDAQVSLTWNAPNFDGGSQVSSYTIYRGTSPGSESFLTGSTTTSFVDASALNGTTYYYKVSATNANGEGPLSNEANATPIAAVTPAALPPPLDSFDRPAENPLSDAGRWSNDIIGGGLESGHYTTANQLACTRTTTCTAWRNSAQYGPDVEVWTRVGTLLGTSNHIRIYARLQRPLAAAYMLRTNEQSGTDEVWLERFDNGAAATRILTMSQELAAGDTLLLRVTGSTVEAWHQPSGGPWSRLGVVQDATHAAAGYVGVGLRGTTGRLDDFGARSLSQNPPGASTALTARAGDAQVSLTWNAPNFDGGSQVSSYTIYRGTSPGSESFLTGSTTTSFVDASALNGTTYYYKVSATNANGEGPLSNEANATPIAAVTPAALPPPLDSFDRPAENPLSDAGRWSNDIIGGGLESGHYTTANQLACTRTTTCTAWRNSAQYGPDVEVWTRVGTLLGTSNHIRIYARLQRPLAAAYMLRTNEQSGTDEVWLERFDNGAAATRILTMSQELAAGDTLLLRVTGSTVEAWHQPSGGPWSRLGVVQDATHAAAGYVGVGLRGTTGRLDDFGARTYGAPPPDTELPGAPGTPSLTPVGPTRIDLTWAAASDNVGVTVYRIERCSGAGCAVFSEIATTAASSYSNTGLAAATSYTYRVRAQDAALNLGPYSGTATASTPAPPDTELPGAPGTPSLTPVGPTRIDLTWAAASDNVGVTVYRIERCSGAGCAVFSEIATTAASSYSNTGLAAATSYTYRVRAQDAALNLGPYSGTATASTPAPPDTELPGAPGTPSLTPVGPTRIDLTWAAASDNVGVTVYRIERCSGAGCAVFSEIATTAASSYSNTGLAAATSYTYRVRAQDAALNLGPYSGTATASTPSGVVAPLEPLPIVDSFNRRNENLLANGWSNGIGGSVETGLRVNSNTVESTKTTTCTAWRTEPALGPDTEVWARVSTLPGNGNQFRLYARLQNAGLAAHSGYALRTNQLAGTDQVMLERIDAGATVTRLTILQELAAGDTLLLRVKGPALEAWLKRGSTWTLLGSVVDSTYGAAGRVGIGIRGKTGRLDDFGAR